MHADTRSVDHDECDQGHREGRIHIRIGGAEERYGHCMLTLFRCRRRRVERSGVRGGHQVLKRERRMRLRWLDGDAVDTREQGHPVRGDDEDEERRKEREDGPRVGRSGPGAKAHQELQDRLPEVLQAPGDQRNVARAGPCQYQQYGHHDPGSEERVGDGESGDFEDTLASEAGVKILHLPTLPHAKFLLPAP